MAERVEERNSAPSRLEWQRAADRNPDDFDPDEEGVREVNPDTGLEYGEVDNSPRAKKD